jgi:hypothetical protein
VHGGTHQSILISSSPDIPRESDSLPWAPAVSSASSQSTSVCRSVSLGTAANHIALRPGHMPQEPVVGPQPDYWTQAKRARQMRHKRGARTPPP